MAATIRLGPIFVFVFVLVVVIDDTATAFPLLAWLFLDSIVSATN
jgi:hypothetical protein